MWQWWGALFLVGGRGCWCHWFWSRLLLGCHCTQIKLARMPTNLMKIADRAKGSASQTVSGRWFVVAVVAAACCSCCCCFYYLVNFSRSSVALSSVNTQFPFAIPIRFHLELCFNTNSQKELTGKKYQIEILSWATCCLW